MVEGAAQFQAFEFLNPEWSPESLALKVKACIIGLCLSPDFSLVVISSQVTSSSLYSLCCSKNKKGKSNTHSTHSVLSGLCLLPPSVYSPVKWTQSVTPLRIFPEISGSLPPLLCSVCSIQSLHRSFCNILLILHKSWNPVLDLPFLRWSVNE